MPTEPTKAKQTNEPPPAIFKQSGSDHSEVQESDRDLRTSRDDNHCRLKVWTFVAAVVAAIGTVAAACFTGWQAITANNALYVSERPWLGVYEVALVAQLTDEGPNFANVRLQNSGKSPALNLRLHIQDVITGYDRRLTPRDAALPGPENKSCPLIEQTTGGPLVLPGAAMNITYMFNGWPKLTDLVNLGAVRIHVIGCVMYEDQFKDVHHTKFCSYLDPMPHPSDPTKPAYAAFTTCSRGDSEAT